jgi:endoglycosylceramidase
MGKQMMFTAIRGWVFGVGIMALLLAGCGDDDDPAARPTATLAAVTGTPTQAPPRTATPTATSPGGATPTATRTGTGVRTPDSTPQGTISATPTAITGRAELFIRPATGDPGTTVTIDVRLSVGTDVAGTQNDIGFAPQTRIAARSSGRPNCRANDLINKGATSFAFQPPDCEPGLDCTAARALVLSLDNVDPIPVGSVLYTCDVAIAADAPLGEYALTCLNADASDPDGNPLPTTCRASSVQVGFLPIPSPTPTFPLNFTPSPAPTGTSTPTPNTGASGALGPLYGYDRWLLDGLNRVVMLHGVNLVAKRAPFHPSAFGFGADDAAFLADEGFNAVRLGVDFRGLMPTPGVIETAYIDALAETVAALAAEHILVLLDFHQDGFAPMYNGNGLPDWMAIDDGLPNPPEAVFPLYYIQNPAMQRAFESFWANRAGPGGVGLQEYFVQGVEAVAARFAGEPAVIGTELMNEPWPGAVWEPCALEADGCPLSEQNLLVPFYQRGATALRHIGKLVFVEPFVLFNFGMARTTLPGTDPLFALSFHSYALDVAGEEGVVANAVAAAQRDRRPLICTEFGATTDPVLIERITGQLETAMVPWMFWTYDEAIIADEHAPAGPDNLRSVEAFNALVRPYPVATNGTPTAIGFDPATRRFAFSYDTAGPDGESQPTWVLTVVSVPARQYPDGYTVTVSGAVVVSEPGAERLLLRTDLDAEQVSVEVVPAG